MRKDLCVSDLSVSQSDYIKNDRAFARFIDQFSFFNPGPTLGRGPAIRSSYNWRSYGAARKKKKRQTSRAWLITDQSVHTLALVKLCS
jgi:hypothetical protein